MGTREVEAMSEKEHTVTVTLDPEMWKRFLKVKEASGMIHNTNVLKWLITNEYERVMKTGRVVIPFNKQDMRQLRIWAAEFGVTVEDFMEQAVKKYMEKGVGG